MKRCAFIYLLGLLIIAGCANEKEKKPNIIFIFIDDMGYADLGSYGNKKVQTPNIDKLASEGILFKQFYVNSPICSPSRVAVLTGQYPSRWGITSFIHTREANAARGMKNYLSTEAPSVADNLQKAGYYTAHIGKWHMGGGRDVDDAPHISSYGFDESLTQFEGLGERYLATYETLPWLKDSTRFLEKWSSELKQGPIYWAQRENFTQIFVDHTIKSIEHAKTEDKPFYINLWPDDIHTPLEPPENLRGDLSTEARFLGVMNEMDKQMGRLFDYIRNDPALAENTLIVLTSDNGPDKNVNDAGNLRGHKTNLYEGGFREPFIVWWTGMIPTEKMGTVDETTVMAGIDLPLTFMAAAGAKPHSTVNYDGENMLDAITGKTSLTRSKSLAWLRPPDRPDCESGNAPDLALRKGKFKLLMDVDGSNMQLYNLEADESERKNLADADTLKAKELKDELLNWYKNYPHQIDRSIYEDDLNRN